MTQKSDLRLLTPMSERLVGSRSTCDILTMVHCALLIMFLTPIHLPAFCIRMVVLDDDPIFFPSALSL